MAKPKKRPTASKPLAQTTTKAKTPLDAVIKDTFEVSLRFLREEIDAITSGIAEDTEHDRASRVAYLAKMFSQVLAEKRKTDGAAKKQFEKLSRSIVVAWFRQQSTDEQDSITRELASMRSEGSILS